MNHRYDYRDDLPPHRRHSPTYANYAAERTEYSPVRDRDAVHVAERRYEYPDRRGQVEAYEADRHRPRSRDYYYEKRRPHSRPSPQEAGYYDGHRHDHRDVDHHRHRHRDHSKRRRSSSGPNWSQAAIAAASAGIIEAGLSRHDRDRKARVMTAAAGAGAIDAVAGKNNEKKHKSLEHIVGSTVGGLVVDRVAHGSGRR